MHVLEGSYHKPAPPKKSHLSQAFTSLMGGVRSQPCFFFCRRPLPFGGSPLEAYPWTSGESNHHRQSVRVAKNDALPTEPRGHLVRSQPWTSQSTCRAPRMHQHTAVEQQCIPRGEWRQPDLLRRRPAARTKTDPALAGLPSAHVNTSENG